MHAFVGLPQVSMSTARACSTPRCSIVTRRTALRIACITVSAALLPPPAKATSLYEKKVMANMAKVALASEKAKLLKTTVEQWKEKFSEEDGLYILRFIPIWLETGRVAMVDIAAQTDVDVGDRGNAKQFGDAMLGHLFELKTEAKAGSREGVIRELDEIMETAEAFLAISELQRLKPKKR